MPSIHSDIVPGATFRPRVSGKCCSQLRANDTCTIVSYVPPKVEIQYTSDKASMLIADAVLLKEYKLGSTLPSGMTAKATKPATSTAPVAAKDPYVIGSLWLGTGAFIIDQPLKIMDVTSTDIYYQYLRDEDEIHYKDIVYFKAYTTPWKAPTGKVTSSNSNSCKHTDTTWYGDEEVCRNCDEIVRTLTVNNPYSVDPDLRKIPDYIAQRINRNAIPSA